MSSIDADLNKSANFQAEIPDFGEKLKNNAVSIAPSGQISLMPISSNQSFKQPEVLDLTIASEASNIPVRDAVNQSLDSDIVKCSNSSCSVSKPASVY